MNFYEQIFSRGRATGEGMTHFERLFAAKFGGSPAPEVREYTGAVPVTITADGTPLLDYIISGNTVQSGTPTPDSPVTPQGTGERTGNLFDYTTVTFGKYISASGEEETSSGTGEQSLNHSDYIPINAGITYTFKCDKSPIESATFNSFCWFDSNKQFINRVTFDVDAIDPYILGTATAPINAAYLIMNYRGLHGDTAMLNTGSTALPYEPYGYKIPISSAGQTTTVYLGEVETTRDVKKLVLTGEEDVSLQSINSYGVANFYIYIPTTKRYAVCTHLKQQTTNIGNTQDEGFLLATASGSRITFYIRIFSSTAATPEELQTYLAQQYAAGTPVTIWYVLTEPETAIVNEPLMKIGDYADTLSKEQAGVAIPTNNGSTTIDVDTTVKPSEVYIEFMG